MKPCTVKLDMRANVGAAAFNNVPGYAFEVDAVPLVVHKTPWSAGGWQVTEPRTGKRVCCGADTRADAIRDVHALAVKLGPGVMAARIAEAVAQQAAEAAGGDA